MTRWSAPVRYAEVDGQGVVFNAHYLLYCDEALSAFFAERGLRDVAADLRLVTSTLTWQASATWGDVVDVDARCLRVGRTSVVLAFEIHVGDRRCCSVETTYVHTDADGTPQPVPDAVRAALT
jgi:acyl-CoA thioester hydrolase